MYRNQGIDDHTFNVILNDCLITKSYEYEIQDEDAKNWFKIMNNEIRNLE